MSYIKDSLSKNEEIHETYKLHWFSKIPLIIWVLLALPTFGITLILAIYEWLKLRSLEQGSTNKRIVKKTGIIARKTDEMKVDAVETVEIKQGVWGRILGYGNVHISGRGIGDLVFVKIDNPMAVKRSIESIEAL